MNKIEQLCHAHEIEETSECRSRNAKAIDIRMNIRGLVREDNTISGIAVPYNSSSVLLRDRPRPYREMFTRNAMTVGENVALYVQHDSTGLPLARTGANTLQFEETDDGLRFSAKLPESRKDVIEAVSRGDIGGVSIGFIVEVDEWEHRKDATPSTRTVVKAHLIELSLVAAGAYPSALLD